MVKVREFCCGCSLRSGTFTIAWGLLLCSTFALIGNVGLFFTIRRRYSSYPEFYKARSPFTLYLCIHRNKDYIVGIAVSVTALCALHKNKITLLNGLYWYLCYTVACFILSTILLISEPEWEIKLVETNPVLRAYDFSYIDIVAMFVILYIFTAVVISYFTLIVKSYMDYSLRNEAQNVQFVGPDATTVGYIAA